MGVLDGASSAIFGPGGDLDECQSINGQVGRRMEASSMHGGGHISIFPQTSTVMDEECVAFTLTVLIEAPGTYIDVY